MPRTQKKSENITEKPLKTIKKNPQSFKYVTGVVMGATVGALAGFVVRSIFSGSKDSKIGDILDNAKSIGQNTLSEIQRKTEDLQSTVEKAQSKFIQS